MSDDFDTVLVVDFGAQYAQLIARRVREAHVYSEIVPHTMPMSEMLARRPAGIILSGGPKSGHVEGAPSINPEVFEAGVPGLGICYGAQLIAQPPGQEILKAFLYEVCGCRPNWTMTSIIESSVEAIRSQVGTEKVICGLSGGVDSAVAAALVHKAVGDQLTCVYVDTGLMRAGESEQVEETFRRQFQVVLVHVKASDHFLYAIVESMYPQHK